MHHNGDALQTALAHAEQARNALDAFGFACITVRVADGRLLWQTPLARELLLRYTDPDGSGWLLPPEVADWLRRMAPSANVPATQSPRYTLAHGARRLVLHLHPSADDDSECLLVMREESGQSAIEALRLCFQLTAREAEVLYWLAQGKINRDIAAIVGASPATVKKHLERIYAKLGVETRTAAAGMALQKI